MLGSRRSLFMHRVWILTAFALAACNAQPNSSTAQQTGAAATTAVSTAATDTGLPVVAPWFICDGIDTPALFEVEQAGSVVRIAEYSKPSGALVNRTEYDEGEGDSGMSHT